MDNFDLGVRSKEVLADFVPKIDERLEKYWDDELSLHFGYGESQKRLVKEMLLHAKEHNLRSAKRARAAFVYFAYKLGGGRELEKIMKVAEAVELIHTALLMHDDFMDEDMVRRGNKTTHEYFANGDKHYGESMAVNMGDVVMYMGYERLINCGFESEKIVKAMGKLLRGITNTAFGQAFDVSLPRIGELTEESVLNLHRAKTALYTYENPLLIGGILAGLPDDIQGILKEYSADGGVAFQLQDDILGVFGDEEKTGKSADSDLLQGKVTLLVVKVFDLGTEEQKETLRKVWGKKSASKEEVELAKRAIKESGSYQYSVDLAKKLNERSIRTMQRLRGIGLDEEAVDFLEGIARYMMEREV